MTRNEAIDVFEGMKCGVFFADCEIIAEAAKIAIEALQAPKQGEWIDKGEYAECSICGGCSGTQFDGVEPIPLETNFCPNCGARMRGEEK